MLPTYTNDALLGAVRVTPVPRSGRTVSGYGARLATRYMLTYAGRERRVYAMSYGNASSAYVNVKGETVFLSPEAERRVMYPAV